MKTNIRFDLYTPQELRDEIDFHLKKCGDAKTAAYMAIQTLNQRYGVTDMDNLSKAKELTKLVKKVITNKKGIQQTVYVKPEGSKTEWLNKFMNFFSFKSTSEVNQRIEQDYKKNQLDKKGVTWQQWKDHVSEYFSNKDKWDRFFSGKPTEKKEQEKKAEAQAKKSEKKPKTSVYKLSLMKFIAGMYGNIPEKKEEPVKLVEKPIENKPVENNFETMPELEPEPAKKEPVKTGEESIQSKFDRWKSGDLTGIEENKFYMTETLTDGKNTKTFFDEIVIKKNENGFLSYKVLNSEDSGGRSINGFIRGLKDGSIIPVGLEKPVDTGNGSKIETVKTYTPEQRKEVNNDAKETAREGFFNEKPAEILNVGKDVWGAARHNYDTYNRMNVDVNSMEKDGTAQAYVTKKNLFGDYGLANKDERVKSGETEFKVLASFVMREYLSKMPPDDPESRTTYMNFCRAISRLDQETTDAKTFYFGVADVFANMFPTEAQKPATPGQGMSVLDMIPQERKGKKPEMIIGPVLTALFYSLNQQANQSRNIYYTMDKKERKQMDIMSAALLAETGKTNKTYNQLEVMIFGETKLAGIKMKKGDNVVFADNLKDRVYAIRIDFASNADKVKHDALIKEMNNIGADGHFLYASNKEKEKLLPKINEKYGTNFTMEKSWEVTKYIDELVREKSVEAAKYRIRTKIFPEDKGQIIKVGKSDVEIAFKFPDGTIKGFRMKPNELKPENVESISKDIKKKETLSLNLAVEKKVIRKGGKDFSGLSIIELQNKLTEDFKFKAIQYGNSVPDDERQYHTQWTLESMSDLEDITGIPLEQLTARGKLGIAFGARGKPIPGIGAGALAHYEPTTKMINITRANGYGSLAHEWAHFADNILSPDMNNFITVQPRAIVKEVNSSSIKVGSIYEHETRKGKKTITERYYYDGKDPEWPFAKLNNGQNEPDSKSMHSNFYKFKNGQSIKVLEPDNLPFMNIAATIARLSQQSLHDQANKLDDGIKKNHLLESEYLNDRKECFARAFETYVADKLKEKGRVNTYLVSHRKSVEQDGASIYPQGELRKEINAMFDEFFAEINKNQEMKKAIDKLLKQNKNVYIKKTNPITGEPEYRKVK
jgi:hypothetical protein